MYSQKTYVYILRKTDNRDGICIFSRILAMLFHTFIHFLRYKRHLLLHITIYNISLSSFFQTVSLFSHMFLIFFFSSQIVVSLIQYDKFYKTSEIIYFFKCTISESRVKILNSRNLVTTNILNWSWKVINKKVDLRSILRQNNTWSPNYVEFLAFFMIFFTREFVWSFFIQLRKTWNNFLDYIVI